jgi:hypothetical protein
MRTIHNRVLPNASIERSTQAWTAQNPVISDVRTTLGPQRDKSRRAFCVGKLLYVANWHISTFQREKASPPHI